MDKKIFAKRYEDERVLSCLMFIILSASAVVAQDSTLASQDSIFTIQDSTLAEQERLPKPVEVHYDWDSYVYPETDHMKMKGDSLYRTRVAFLSQPVFRSVSPVFR